MSETTFENAQVGDRVYSFLGGSPDAYGRNATIQQLQTGNRFSLIVRHDHGFWNECAFTIAGFPPSSTEQLLFWSKPEFQIPERPKRKVKKTVTMWQNIYAAETVIAGETWITRAEADNCGNGRIACVELKGEYEVEE